MMISNLAGQRSKPPQASARKDFGDFQTPRALVDAILDRILAGGERFERVLEPTCGTGQFLAGLLAAPCSARELRGVELQADHAAAARTVVGDRGQILHADLFELDLIRELRWNGGGRLLVIGNPPWVTVAALGASGGTASNPGPVRSNARRVPGIMARTGGSNFDLAEAVWGKLIRELATEQPTIALLCKTSVARALLRSLRTDALPVTAATFWKIDAARWFRASVAAGLLRIEVGPGPLVREVPVYSSLAATVPEAHWGIGDGTILADLAAYRRSSFADGVGPLAWRQGVKHDAARVLELAPQVGGGWANGLGAMVDVEPDWIYPWFKATDVARGTGPEPRRCVVVTQRALNEPPDDLARTSPKLWGYLQAHADHFARRKSSIYQGRAPFSLFGIGPYTFSPYKVAISGLHKSFRFRAIGPLGGRPPLVDDTCYFLPCPSAEAACTLAAALNSPEATDLLLALTFADNKRPITQAILKRVDLRAVLARTDQVGLRARAEAEWGGLADPGSQLPASWPLIWQDDWATAAHGSHSR